MTRTRTFLLVAMTAAIGLPPLSAFAKQTGGGSVQLDRTLDAFKITDGMPQELFFDENVEFGVVMTVVELEPGVPMTLELSRHSMRADGFQVLVDDGSGTLVQVDPPEVQTYRGIVLEDPELRVRGSFDGARLRAIITGPTGTWGIQPMADAGLQGRPGDHMVYSALFLQPEAFECGTDDSHASSSTLAFGGTTGNRICDIACDADYEFFLDNNSSVGATVNDIEDLLNSVESEYEHPDIQITYEVTAIVVRTSPGTYTTTSSGALLNQFDNNWSNAPENSIQRDIAHLFTGENLAGTVIGIASLSSICSAFNGYGLSQSHYTVNYVRRVSLTAHELGHNWSATHCNSSPPCRIMCSSNGGCSGLSPLEFGPTARAQIFGFRNTRSCLSIEQDPLTLPFIEEFTTSSLAADQWSYIRGATTSTAGVAEPSSPFSLRLNASGSGTYADDQIRSNFINLAGTGGPILQYFTQHVGVPSGGTLFVEYWRTSEQWVTINTIVSNGSSQSSFQQHSHVLPGSARHSQFRVRFRVQVGSTSHNFYVDNISVTDGPPPTIEPPLLLQVNPGVGPTGGGTFVSILGANLATDATVLFGLNELQNFNWVNANLITGTTPATPTSGPVAVSVAQSSGIDVATGGFLYLETSLAFSSPEGAPGGMTDLLVRATHEADLGGFSLAASFPGQWVDILEVNVAGTDAEGADFVAPNYSNLPGDSWWTVGVVLDIAPPIENTLAAGSNHDIARAVYLIDPLAPPGTLIQVTPQSGVGSPAVDVIFSLVGGTSTIPTMTSGVITIIDTAFIRGDANLDGSVDVADAVTTLEFLFSGALVNCLDALDANDDGAVDVADAIYSLNFQFAFAAAPPPPFPNPGPDPTPDTLDCNP